MGFLVQKVTVVTLVLQVHSGPKGRAILAHRGLLVFLGFLESPVQKGWASLDQRAMWASGGCQVHPDHQERASRGHQVLREDQGL